MKNIKKKKKHIRISGLLLILLILYLIGNIIYFIFTMPIKNIVVKGINLLTENEIISLANIKDKELLIKASKSKISKNILTNALVNKVLVSRTITGKIIITIEENKILFYNVLKNEVVLSNGKTMETNNNYLGYPNLINYIPNEIYDSFIKSFSKISSDIISMISEIEYSPNKYNDIVLDDERFLLKMNDGNKVYINNINIEKLNNYQTIYANVGSGGTLYLDSSSKNYIFKTFKQEQEEVKEKEVKESEN